MELTDDEMRNVAQDEVAKHVLAFPHPSWESVGEDGPEGVVAKTHLAAETAQLAAEVGATNSDKLEVILCNQDSFNTKLDSLADVVLGEESVNFDGNIVREGGLQKLVADSHNGGMKVKLPPAVTAALVTAMAGIFTTLLILIFQHI